MAWMNELKYARFLLKVGCKEAGYERLVQAMQIARRDNASIQVRALIIMAVNAAHEAVQR